MIFNNPLVYAWHIEFMGMENKMSNDSLDKAAGKGVTVNIKGTNYKVSPITLGDLADFEAYVRSNRIKLFLGEADVLSAEDRRSVLKDLCSQAIDEDTVASEMSTLNGVRYLLCKALEKKHPDITLETISTLVDMDNLETISTIVQTIGGAEVSENPPVTTENI